VVIPVAGLCWAVDVALDDVGRLNELVGSSTPGHLETVPLGGDLGAFGFINEDGKGLGLEFNRRASLLADIPRSDYIVGPMVIFGRLSALDPDFTDCPPVLVNALVRR
jgi:hypothetical protein